MKLIFVYNIDGDPASLVKATVHKLASPKTYTVCNLCKLTYPFISMEKEWKKFLVSLPYEAIMLHRDEFQEKYPEQKDITLPSLLAEDESSVRVLASANEINKALDIKDLKALVLRVLPSSQKSNEDAIHRCQECGLKYRDKAIAEQCQAWCKEHQSCNLEIIKHAIKNDEH